MEQRSKKKKHVSKATIRKYRFLAVLFAVPLVNFVVFWLFLNVSAIDFAFKVELGDGSVVYSLDNFKALFQSMTIPGSTFWISLRNTLLYWCSSVLSYVVAVLVGYFLFKKVPGSKAYRFIFYVPTLIAPTILVALFKQLVAANGPLSVLYGGMENVPRFLTSESLAIWTCLFYSFFFGFGQNLLIISGAMSQVDSAILDAGRIDGAGMPRELFNIVLPVIWPTIIATLINMIAGIFNASGPILLLTEGNYQTRTIAYWIFEQVYTGQNYYYSAAIGLFFALLTLPLVFFSRWLLRKVVPSNDSLEED